MTSKKELSSTKISSSLFKESYKTLSLKEFESFTNNIASKYIDESIRTKCDYILIKRDTIDYNFSINYKKEWGVWESIREIIQNSMDTDSVIDIYTPNENTIVIHDEGKGISVDNLMLGGGEKAEIENIKNYYIECDPENIIRGAHGEGMKLTFLVLSKHPNLFKLCLYSRCLRITPELIMSQRFKKESLNLHLDPSEPHKGTTFILNTDPEIIKEIINYCKTRFIYDKLYVNEEKIKHTKNDILSTHIIDNKVTYKSIGQIIDINLSESTNSIEKPLYIRGIYINNIKTIFSYDFICPVPDSARNIIDIKQITDQIKRIYNNLEFNGIDTILVTEHFIRTLYNGKDKEYIENSVILRNITSRAKLIYRKVWDIVFGKNKFIPTNNELTQLASEQIYIEKDENGNTIKETYYEPIELQDSLKTIFIESGVNKDSDVIKQETIDIPCSPKDIKESEWENLKNAISILCPIYDLNPIEEIKKWDVFYAEYKTENQPPRNLWKNWNNIENKTRIISGIHSLYIYYSKYPLMLEKGLKLPIIDNYSDIFDVISDILNEDKQTITKNYPNIAKLIEQFENRIIPIEHKLGYYNLRTKRFGIRYDCILNRDKAFTVVIHEYAHAIKEVDDIDDYDSSMGKILSVVQNGYGKILDESLKYADIIYTNHLIKTFTEIINSSNTKEDMLESIKKLPSNISDIIFTICEKKNKSKEKEKSKLSIYNVIYNINYDVVIKEKYYDEIYSAILLNSTEEKYNPIFINIGFGILSKILYILRDYSNREILSISNIILDKSLLSEKKIKYEYYSLFKEFLKNLLEKIQITTN